LPAGSGDGVADLDGALFEHGLGQVRGGVPAGAPGGPGGHRAGVAAYRPDLSSGVLHAQARVIEDFPQELLDVFRVDPGRAEPRVDLPWRQIGRDHPPQFGGVNGERRIILGGALGPAQLLAHIPGQVLGSRYQPSCRRVVEHQRAKLGAGVVLGGAEQPGDLAQPHLTRSVQADGQRVGGGVGAQPRGARRDDAFAEDGRLGGALAGRVELFQGVDQRRERVFFGEPALRRPGPGHDRLAGGRIGPAGAPQRETVQRAVAGQVSVVAASQLGAQLTGFGCVIGGGGLGREHGPCAVAQREQLPQLGCLAGRDEMRLFGAVDNLGECAIRPGAQVPVGLSGLPGFGSRSRGSVRGLVRRHVGEAAQPGVAGQRIEGGGQRADRVAGWADHQVTVPVGAAGGAHLAEHRLRAVQEVLADRDLGAVQLGVPGLLPARLAGLAAGLAAAQHQ
jgi:hypothetical protein